MPPLEGESLPKVTVQIPVYNERYVVERAIQAAAALDYPCDRLQIQILDDSIDDTHLIAQRAVEDARATGVHIELIHRSDRSGYKAGALANGMATANGEFIAIFDADFIPRVHFLRRLISEHRVFDDPDVGFAQTRWSFLNREDRILTRAQALMLDKHFFIEQPARSLSGLLFNFNGSGGIWRRSCLEDAGGWEHDTLTEDLDLSYRAQIKGWRGIYFENETAPNELPTTLLAFKRQQRRWARGSTQCLRKLFPRILRASLSPWQKLAAWMHLTGYFFQLFLFLFIILWPPTVLLGLFHKGSELVVPIWIHCLSPICLAVMMSMFAAHQKQHRKVTQFLRDLPAAILLTIGVTFSNTVSVLLGLFYRPSGEFERTPKEITRPLLVDEQGRSILSRTVTASLTEPGAYTLKPDWTMWVELGLGCYGIATFTLLLQQGYISAALPMLFYGGAFSSIGLSQLYSLLWRRSTNGLKAKSSEPSLIRPVIELDDA
jgi:glycosyltransferase involved in cell wall biosynthesis